MGIDVLQVPGWETLLSGMKCSLRAGQGHCGMCAASPGVQLQAAWAGFSLVWFPCASCRKSMHRPDLD